MTKTWCYLQWLPHPSCFFSLIKPAVCWQKWKQPRLQPLITSTEGLAQFPGRHVWIQSRQKVRTKTAGSRWRSPWQSLSIITFASLRTHQYVYLDTQSNCSCPGQNIHLRMCHRNHHQREACSDSHHLAAEWWARWQNWIKVTEFAKLQN